MDNNRWLMALLASYLWVSCKGQTGVNATTPPPGPDLQTMAKAGVDPNFVASGDTVSQRAPHCITREVLQAKNGDYWLASWQGIVRYDGKRFTNYTLRENLIRFHVFCCVEDSKGNLWFGTARGGVYRYDGRTFRLFTTQNGLVDDNVTCLLEDKAGNMWFGTEHGACRFDGASFTTLNDPNGPQDRYVNDIMQDKNGQLWFGTSTGLFVFDGVSCAAFTNRDGKPFRTLSLLEDRLGNIWIGRWDGLTRYDGSRFDDFLSNLLTYYLVEDRSGNIWCAHSEPNLRHPNLPSQVLYRYDGSTFEKILVKDDADDFQIFGNMVDRSGQIWFGTMKGLCRYDGKSVTLLSE